MSYQLDTDALDRAWNNWLNDVEHSEVYRNTRPNFALKFYVSKPRKYNVGRNSPLGKQFEDWLWSQGAHVVQIEGKRCARFSEYETLISFKLTWCLK